MSEVVAQHDLTFRPDYRTVILRDSSYDARVGASDAIGQAQTTIAAATPYELYIVAAQPELQIRVELIAWDQPPPDNAHPPAEWDRVGQYDLPFPTGNVVLGDGVLPCVVS